MRRAVPASKVRPPLFHYALLAALPFLAAAPAFACTIAPHEATRMPESLSNPWSGAGTSLAWFDGPTTRYPHGVLGDEIEATQLVAYSDDAPNLCGDVFFELPQELVFEDLAPRLADLDGDGAPEIIVVQSHQRLGAQLAIYRVTEGEIQPVATTPFIGRRNRWLAPVGAADFDGDGTMDIAYVDRPHLARTLRVWRFEDDTLVEYAALEGLTNHRIGEDFITGGVRDCGDGPEMILADRDWTRVVAVSVAGAAPEARTLAPFSAENVAEALECGL